MADYDILGNIVLIKGEGKTKKEKLAQAKELLKRPSVKTVLEKASNFSGRLRKIKVKHILGEKNTIAYYKENDCNFKFDVGTCYFSSRLSNERKLNAMKIEPKDKVLVMFAGIGVYPMVIYKMVKPEKIVGVEISRECTKYFKENLKLNKIPEGKIEVIQGDVKKKIDKNFGKFDVVIMARPNLKESFLKQGLNASKRGTKLFYHAFCRDIETDYISKKLIKEASEYKRKIELVDVVPAGEIAPFKHRFRMEFKVLK